MSGLTRRTHVAATWLAAGAAAACAGNAPVAELILHDARVYTLAWPDPAPGGRPAAGAPWDSAGGWRHDATAVAIGGGRILYVGSDSGALALRRDSTTVIDLDGATLLPGMVDAHTHVAELGQSLDRINLTGVATEAEAVERVAERAARTPNGEWILGWGWDEGAWANRYPDKRLLSARVPDHPVVLRGLHGFATWANSRALAAAGVTSATRPPVGGEIRLGGDGQPTGLFLNRAVEIMDGAVPRPSAGQRDSQVVRGLREMAQAGYTAVHEAGVPRAVMESLVRLDAQRALPIRVYAMLDGRDSTLVREWIYRGILIPQASVSGRLTVRAIKAYYDGALGSRGARLLADYSDRPGHRGVSGNAYGFDHAIAAAAMAAGFQLAIHAIGDEGNRAALDFIDSVMAVAPRAQAGRHRVEHAQVVSPQDIPRFAALGAIASMQPPHAIEDMPWAEQRLGSERMAGAYAWRALRMAGAKLVLSSDLPGSDWNLFYGWHSAMTRKDRTGRPAGGWYPDQQLTAEEAIRGYSVWAAHAAFSDDVPIAAGRPADLTAVSIDPFRAAADTALLRGRVLLTVVAGRVVPSVTSPR